jgi:prepilin-type processing-associated H-X9-DG protein
LVRPRSDNEDPATGTAAGIIHTNEINYAMGSAHPGGINVVFADGSTTGISYDVDLEVFNRLGNRFDGEVSAGSL